VQFAFSAMPGSAVPGRFAWLGHFLTYAVLGALVWVALYPRKHAHTALAVAVLVSSAYGVSDEIHQAFVPGRTPDVVDWGVDTLGALVGATVVWLATRTKGARRRPSAD